MKYVAMYNENDTGYASSLCDTPNEAIEELKNNDDEYFLRYMDNVRIYHVCAEESIEVGGYTLLKKKSYDGKSTK